MSETISTSDARDVVIKAMTAGHDQVPTSGGAAMRRYALEGQAKDQAGFDKKKKKRKKRRMDAVKGFSMLAENLEAAGVTKPQCAALRLAKGQLKKMGEGASGTEVKEVLTNFFGRFMELEDAEWTPVMKSIIKKGGYRSPNPANRAEGRCPGCKSVRVESAQRTDGSERIHCHKCGKRWSRS